MKAKMLDKQPEAAKYLCTRCEKQFVYRKGSLACPRCSNSKRDELVPIYLKNDPEEENMYTNDDWHGG